MAAVANNDSTDTLLLDHSMSLATLRAQNPNLENCDEYKSFQLSRVKPGHRKAPPRAASMTTAASRSQLIPSISGSGATASSDVVKTSTTRPNQKFWKYHVITVAKHQFYLTTNPDIKHIYCRAAPGYFIQLVLPQETEKVGQRQADRGFRLIFKRQNYEDPDKPEECIVVTKESANEGGSFQIVAKLANAVEGVDYPGSATVKDKAHEVPIRELELISKKDPDNLELHKLIETLHRYESNFNDRSWLIGSNPIPKQKRSNMLGINSDIFKLTGKQNVYFCESEQLEIKALARRSSILKSLRSSSAAVKPREEERILALYRPHERRLKKKFIKTVSSSTSTAIPQFTSSSAAKDSDHYNYIESEKQYYSSAGDGLLQQNPKDDSPNDTKLGWLTIYESDDSKNMWDVIVGYTFAVGFERIIDEYLQTADAL